MSLHDCYEEAEIEHYRVRSYGGESRAGYHSAHVPRRYRKKSVGIPKPAIASIAVMLATVLVVVTFMATNPRWYAEAATLFSAPTRLDGQTDAAGSPDERAAAEGEVFDTPIAVSDIQDSGQLKLVNREYALDDATDPTLVPITPTVAGVPEPKLLQPDAASAVSGLLDEAFEAGFSDLIVTDGYRSYDEQARIYESTEDTSYVLPPGHSEHQTGLAADIADVVQGSMTDASEATDAENRLAESAWRYGLILRYPAGKEIITQVSYEPWHFRYVGLVHAEFMHQNNLCFEEYIEYLRSVGNYRVTLRGQSYYVSYQVPVDGILYVPSDSQYTVSGVGDGAYIVETRR